MLTEGEGRIRAMADGYDRLTIEPSKIEVLNLLISILKINNPQINEKLSISGIFPTVQKLILSHIENDILVLKFVKLFNFTVDTYYKHFQSSILNFKKLTKFLEDF